MRIFVLNTGRCGSTTWIKACQHVNNYSAAHESRVQHIGDERLAYADNHIEADNRLSWYLGRLDELFGNDAFYVHLSRKLEDTVQSFAKRTDFGIMQAYREGILIDADPAFTAEALAQDYVQTVESNIALFLKDKENTLEARLETGKQDFTRFWGKIAASGDLDKALAEFDVLHNHS